MMAIDKPYLSIPGTAVFDMDVSRHGYWLNHFCMSLMSSWNRVRFKAGELANLDEWPMSEAPMSAPLARDLSACIRFGGYLLPPQNWSDAWAAAFSKWQAA